MSEPASVFSVNELDESTRIVEGPTGVPLLTAGESARPIVEACFSEHASLALLYAENMAPEFFDLSSGNAGAVLQQLRNYGVRLAVVATLDRQRGSTRFGEMVAEERAGREFGVFGSRDEALDWLRSG